MIKQAILSIFVALVVGGVTLEPEPASAAECSAGWGRKVTKLAGLSSYPAACRSTVCHVGSHEASRVVFEGFPAQPVVYFRYRASATSGLGLPACPSDVNAAAFSKP